MYLVLQSEVLLVNPLWGWMVTYGDGFLAIAIFGGITLLVDMISFKKQEI